MHRCHSEGQCQFQVIWSVAGSFRSRWSSRRNQRRPDPEAAWAACRARSGATEHLFRWRHCRQERHVNEPARFGASGLRLPVGRVPRLARTPASSDGRGRIFPSWKLRFRRARRACTRCYPERGTRGCSARRRSRRCASGPSACTAFSSEPAYASVVH